MSTDWEAHYQKGEMPWEKGAASPGLVDFLASRSLAGRVLVPGCGAGHDARAIAATGAEVLGIDIAPSAVALASGYAKVRSETFQLGDLFALPEVFNGAFDWVWEHTCFCAIDPEMRRDYVEATAQVLRPGGHFLAMFYLDPGHEDPDDGPPFGVSIAELDELFLPRFELISEWLPERSFPGREGREWLRLMRKRDSAAS